MSQPKVYFQGETSVEKLINSIFEDIENHDIGIVKVCFCFITIFGFIWINGSILETCLILLCAFAHNNRFALKKLEQVDILNKTLN